MGLTTDARWIDWIDWDGSSSRVHLWHVRRAAVGAAALVVALGGCGGDGAESAQTDLPEAGGESPDDQPTSQPPSPSEASPTTGPGSGSSPDDRSGELVSEYPEAGLSFELPEVQGPETAILEAFLQFESERWIAQRDTREVSAELEAVATGDALEKTADGLEHQRENDVLYTGEATADSMTVDRLSDQNAQVNLCYDGSGVTVEVDGEVDQGSDGIGQEEFTVDLVFQEGWHVVDYYSGDPC